MQEFSSGSEFPSVQQHGLARHRSAREYHETVACSLRTTRSTCTPTRGCLPVIIEETSELEHAWNYTKHMYTHTLVQCPLQFYATPMRGDTEEDVCALLDTEGSDIISEPSHNKLLFRLSLLRILDILLSHTRQWLRMVMVRNKFHQRMCGRQYPSGLLSRFDIDFVS